MAAIKSLLWLMLIGVTVVPVVSGAKANKDQTITISELQAYISEQVRTLTQGGQNPTVRTGASGA